MNINLRKASALVSTITDAMNSITVTTKVAINEFEDPADVLTSAIEAYKKADARKKNLLVTLYNVRTLIGAANASAGIDIKLAMAAMYTKSIEHLQKLELDSPVKSIDLLRRKLNKISERTQPSLYGSSDINTCIFSESEINAIKAEILELKRKKQKLNDEILELNVKTEISLTPDTVKFLTSENLI